MSRHLNKLSKITNEASKGGVILAGVGLAASCYQVSEDETLAEKNEFAVKTIASTGVGTVAGSIATVRLVGTPVGWGIILAVGVTSAAIS